MQLMENKRLFNFLAKGIVLLILVASLLVVSFLASLYVVRVPNVSGVNALSPNIGVYWNVACTNQTKTIGWGNVTLGSEKDITVYIKNLGSDALTLSMNMSAWTPSFMYPKIYLCWDYSGKQVGPGSVMKVVLKLFVSPAIAGVRSFSFNINIGVGLEKSPDINGDGVVSIADGALLGLAWLARAGTSRYDYRCDLNNDGSISIIDASRLATAF